MKLALLPVSALLAAALCTPSNAQSSQPRQEIVPQTLHSTVLDEDRRLLIRLPRHYELDSSARYPVLFKLDGDNQLERYHAAIDILHSMDAIPDLIVVAIPNARGQRNRDLTPPNLHQQEAPDGGIGQGDMGRGDRFLQFVESELIPYIDSNYRTTPERILAGHSRGALLVLYSLISKPDLFQGRFVFSAPLMRNRQRLIADTATFLKANPNHYSFLYCNWGQAENQGMNSSYLAIAELLSSGAPKGLRWTIERARAGDHQQTPVIALPSALRDYFAGRSAGAQPNRLYRRSSTSRP